MPFASTQPDTWTIVMLAVASLLTYFVGRVAIGAVPRRFDRPLLRAFIFAWPVITIAVAAVLVGRPGIAAHLPIAASVMALTAGLALLLLFRPSASTFAPRVRVDPTLPRQAVRVFDAAPQRSWALLLPAVGLVMVATVAGAIDVALACGLLAFGLLAMAGWRRDPAVAAAIEPDEAEYGYEADPTSAVTPPLAAIDPAAAPKAVRRREREGERPSGSLASLVLLAPLIAIAAACLLAAVRGVERWFVLPAEPVVTLLAAMVIGLPMVFDALPPIRPASSWHSSVSTLVLFALVNLTVALPVAALAERYVPKVADVTAMLAPVAAAADDGGEGRMSATRPATRPTTNAATRPATGPSTGPTAPPATNRARIGALPVSSRTGDLRIPSNVWRADVLALSAAALLLIPLAAGVFRAGWLEALALGGIYFLYVLLSVAYLVQM